MKPGPKKTPYELAVVQGVKNKQRLNPDEPKPNPKMPQCPSWLVGSYAHSVWKREAEELHRIGLLTFVDRDLFAAYCIAVMDVKDAYQANDFNKKQKATQRMRMCASEMGKTPTSRASIRGNPSDEEDDFD